MLEISHILRTGVKGLAEGFNTNSLALGLRVDFLRVLVTLSTSPLESSAGPGVIGLGAGEADGVGLLSTGSSASLKSLPNFLRSCNCSSLTAAKHKFIYKNQPKITAFSDTYEPWEEEKPVFDPGVICRLAELAVAAAEEVVLAAA